MRQMVQNTFGRPISIELLERLNLPTSGSSAALNRPAVATTVTTATTNASCVVVNPSLLSQTSSSSTGQQPLLYTTVQPQQKINLLQGTTSTPTLISANTSLLSAQQQQQQQARAQIVRFIEIEKKVKCFHSSFFSNRISVESVRSSQALPHHRTAIYSILKPNL